MQILKSFISSKEHLFRQICLLFQYNLSFYYVSTLYNGGLFKHIIKIRNFDLQNRNTDVAQQFVTDDLSVLLFQPANK